MINPFAKKYTEEERLAFDVLSEIPIFNNLTHKEMSVLVPYMHERNYVKDEIVFLRNDPSHALYIILKGTVLLSIEINGSIEELATIKAGDAIGKSCLLEDARRQTNAIVTSDSARFYVIPQANFFDVFEHKPKIKAKMIEALANEYNGFNSRLFKAYREHYGFFELKNLY